MGRKRIAVLTFSEFVVILGVMGIFASLAIPSYIHIQRTSRIEHLLESARLCEQDLSLWLSTPVSNEPLESDAGGEGSGEAGAGALDPRGVLEDYARNRFERFQHKNLPGDEPLLVVVEPTGTLPVYCKRDGGIHLLPFVDSALESVGATVAVTDEDRNGGPAYDGILAVYSVEPGTE
jgi:hypothetical protein